MMGTVNLNELLEKLSVLETVLEEHIVLILTGIAVLIFLVLALKPRSPNIVIKPTQETKVINTRTQDPAKKKAPVAKEPPVRVSDWQFYTMDSNGQRQTQRKSSPVFVCGRDSSMGIQMILSNRTASKQTVTLRLSIPREIEYKTQTDLKPNDSERRDIFFNQDNCKKLRPGNYEVLLKVSHKQLDPIKIRVV